MANTHTFTGHYLAMFISNNTSAKWRAWYAKSDAEERATDEAGLAAWDAAHRDGIVHAGGEG